MADFAVCSFTDESAVHLLHWEPAGTLLSADPTPARLKRAFAAAAHPSLPLVYATALADDAQVLVLRRRGTPAPTAEVVGSWPLGKIDAPCRIAVDPDGRFLALAGYGSGSVSVVALDSDGLPRDAHSLSFDGSGPDPDRQEASHIHDVIIVDGLIYAADLGTDRVHVVRVGVDGHLSTDTNIALPAGSGPRHIADLGGGFFAVSGELDSTLMLIGPAHGALAFVSAIASTGRTTAERNYPSTVIADARSGLIHLANRGADTVFTARVADGALRAVGETPTGGIRPEHLALDGDHMLVVHSGDGAVTALGTLNGVPTGEISARITIPGAIWIERLPTL